MECAVCCRMTLVFAIMHLHNILKIFIASVHSFFMEWSTKPACPSLMCFFNRGDTEGTNSSNILCLMFVYVLFYINLCLD